MKSKSKNCFVPKCKSRTSYGKEKKELGASRVSLFKAPSDPHILSLWHQAIARNDKLLCSTNVVCSLHFLESDISYFYETKLKDGTVHQIKRGWPKLKPGSVPSIFSHPSITAGNRPSYPKTRKFIPEENEVLAIKRVRDSSPKPSQSSNTISTISDTVITLNIKEYSRKRKMTEEERKIPEMKKLKCSLLENNYEPSGEVSNKSERITVPEGCGNLVTDLSTNCMLKEETFVDKRQGASFIFKQLKQNLNRITTDKNWSGTFIPAKNKVVFMKWDNDTYNPKKKIIICNDLSFKVGWPYTYCFGQGLNCSNVLFGEAEIKLNDEDPKIKNLADLGTIISCANKMRICAGINLNSTPKLCSGMTPAPKVGRPTALNDLCLSCALTYKQRKSIMRQTLNEKRHKKIKGTVRSVTRKNLRLKKKVTKLVKDVEDTKRKCASVKTEILEESISKLSSAQQEAVRTCFAASKVTNLKNRRYALSWIYECLLIRIKGRATYEHLRTHQLLPLPCIPTLNKYIVKMNSCYGFQKSTFELLKKKSSYMKPEERRGTLLIDEMKLTETLNFNTKTLQVHGFTNLGDYTPLHQKNKKGDHALVMMFQPFRGSWVQTLACFLSKGCASSTVLHHLIMECVILMEKAGFFVDLITTDGASWNRSMWKKFNITEENVSCEHMCDPSRRLWFASDFPHLIKNFRNFITQRCETWTPDGILKLSHWDTVVEIEQMNNFSLRVCPVLCKDDIRPKHWQKMNVGRAYRFFSDKVAAAMKIYQPESVNLKDCEPSVALIKRLSTLICIMSSRTPRDRTLKQRSEEEKFIKSFLLYLQEWESYTKANDIYFLSDSTCHGIKVSLKATLELLNFLCEQHNFQYLMTARLNQDALERFFGMMRSACGSNDHPDSRLFIQMFRLLSTYSLVKPPRGSNVEGSQLLLSLLNIEEVVNSEENIKKMRNSLDFILDNAVSITDQNSDFNTNLIDSDNLTSKNFILSYLSGYVSRKASRFSKCNNCLNTLKASQSQERDKMIQLLNKGFLVYPSNSLYLLISTLESNILKVLSTNIVNSDTFFEILSKIEEVQLPLVGCDGHKEELSNTIVRFYLITRMHFICKRINITDADNKEKTRCLRKQSKL